MPFQVVPATGAVLQQVLDDTFPIWNDGLSRDNYSKAWAAQLKTPWGSAHLDRVALVDGPHIVSSAKRYDLSLRLDGRNRRCLGIGAVFTAPAYRGRGGARELLTRILESAVAEGQEFAMLFSEIAPAFYERLDFVPVPLAEWTIEVDQKRGGAPAMLVRSGDNRDLHNIVEMSAARAAGARLALDRSEDFVKFGISRKRLLSGFSPPATRDTEFLVVEEGHQAVAYLVCTSLDGRWVIEEAGDRDPSRRAPRRDAAGDARAQSQRAPSRDPRLVAARSGAAATARRGVNVDARSTDDPPAERPDAAASTARRSGSRVLARGLLLRLGPSGLVGVARLPVLSQHPVGLRLPPSRWRYGGQVGARGAVGLPPRERASSTSRFGGESRGPEPSLALVGPTTRGATRPP